MSDLVITSPANQRLKDLVTLRRRRIRESTGTTLVEGLEETSLALDAGVRPRTLFHCPELMLEPRVGAALVERARDAGVMAYIVKPFTVSDVTPAIEVATSRWAELKALESERWEELAEKIDDEVLVDVVDVQPDRHRARTRRPADGREPGITGSGWVVGCGVAFLPVGPPPSGLPAGFWRCVISGSSLQCRAVRSGRGSRDREAGQRCAGQSIPAPEAGDLEDDGASGA